MTTTATTIFDATTGTLSPKVQSLVSSRVHLGKVFFRPVVPLYAVARRRWNRHMSLVPRAVAGANDGEWRCDANVDGAAGSPASG